MKISTDYWAKPTPERRFDWCAVDDETYDGEGCPIGWGASEAEAIADLKEQVADDLSKALGSEG